MDSTLLIFLVSLIVITIYTVILYIITKRLTNRENDLRSVYEQNITLAEKVTELEDKSKRQNNSQRAVLKGKLGEIMFPMMAKLNERLNLFELRGLGGEPLDYLGYEGLIEAKDNNGQFKKIWFIDVKTGNAKLSGHQEQIRQAIINKQVGFMTVRITDSGEIIIEEEVG